jgi:hypothetical protein
MGEFWRLGGSIIKISSFGFYCLGDFSFFSSILLLEICLLPVSIVDSTYLAVILGGAEIFSLGVACISLFDICCEL